MDPLMRHFAACNNAILPGPYQRLFADGHPVGWVRPGILPQAAQPPNDVHTTMEALNDAARRLAAQGRTRWRDEAFDVFDDDTGAPVGTMDRGALPCFGIRATGVHLNGLVRRGGETFLWVARRAADKALDPGKLDHLAAGGVPAGLTPRQTLLKEAEEEAGLPPDLAAQATEVAAIEYAMDRPEGLRRDRIVCYDLDLPPDWQPEPRDGEVESFALWPLPSVLARVRDTDDFKFNVNLVLIDLFRRHGLIGQDSGSPT